MNNKETLMQELTKLNYTLGCYNTTIDKISKKELTKVISSLNNDYTDIDVKIRNKHYIIELATVESEKDLNILSKEEYISRYGSEHFEDD